MKVLIDSNVILEVILQREEFEAANSALSDDQGAESVESGWS